MDNKKRCYDLYIGSCGVLTTGNNTHETAHRIVFGNLDSFNPKEYPIYGNDKVNFRIYEKELNKPQIQNFIKKNNLKKIEG